MENIDAQSVVIYMIHPMEIPDFGIKPGILFEDLPTIGHVLFVGRQKKILNLMKIRY